MWKIVAGSVGCTSAIALAYTFLAERPASFDGIAPPARVSSSVSAQDGEALTGLPNGSVRPMAAQMLNYSPRQALVGTPKKALGQRSQTRVADIQPPKPQRWTLRIVEPDNSSLVAAARATPAPASLTRQIQREARRVGCGQITVTGYWDRRTKAAAARFAANSNASLPTNKPDVALLSLMRHYQGTRCGQVCSGVVDASGRCVAARQPRLATTPRVVTQNSTGWTATTWTTVVRDVKPAAPTTKRVVVGTHQPTGRTTVHRLKSATAAKPRRVIRPYEPGTSVVEGRMALGARQPYAPAPAPLTTQRRSFTGPSDVYQQQSPPDVEAERLQALREAQEKYLRQQRAKNRRKARRKRFYRSRERLSWRERAFQSRD
ncbi:MAG: hypothetical protein ACR2PA_11060 [Hyphomicrobiaceae bacterium]